MRGVSLHLLLWCPMGLSGGGIASLSLVHHVLVWCQCLWGAWWCPGRWSVGTGGNAQLSPWSLCWCEEEKGPTRLPSGCPASVLTVCLGCALTTHGSPGLPVPSSPLIPHSCTWTLEAPGALLCPLTPRPTDWGQEPFPSSRHTLYLQALLGVAFLLSPSEILAQKWTFSLYACLINNGETSPKWQHKVPPEVKLGRHHSGTKMLVCSSSGIWWISMNYSPWIFFPSRPPTRPFLW